MDNQTFSLAPPYLTPEGAYLLDFPATLLSISQRVIEFANKAEFKQKDETHITIIGTDLAQLIEVEHSTEELVEVLEDIPEWEVTLRDKYYLMAQKDIEGVIRESIIQLVELPALEEVYDTLAKDNVINHPIPIAHITLFTKFNDRGIGIYSQDEFDDYLIRQIY